MRSTPERFPLPLVLFLAPVLLWGGPARGTSAAPAGLEGGPVVLCDRDLEGNRRVRLFGPFVESRKAADGRSFFAVRPFYSRASDPAGERTVTDYLWPAAMRKRFLNETSWRFLLAFGTDFDRLDEESRRRTLILPVYFAGRDINGEDYRAVFPLGGTIHEFLGFDRIFFALFPLYARAQLHDIVTHSILWPVISRSRGEGVYRFRVFPFYGVSRREGQWVKRFVLWPVWTSVRYEEPGDRGGGFVLFPLFGRLRMERQRSWMLVPPLVRWTKSQEATRLNCPWPFVQYGDGAIRRLYLWPLWGRRSEGLTRTWFALWPLVWSQETRRPSETMKRFMALPFFYRQTQTPARPPGAAATHTAVRASASYVKLWPLVSYRREGEAARLRLPDLWPLKDTAPIERNLAPLWTLYAGLRQGEAREREALWGLFRWRRDAAGEGSVSVWPLFAKRSWDGGRSREWSFLLGLARHRREGLHRTLRLLYCLDFPSGDRPAGSPQPEIPGPEAEASPP